MTNITNVWRLARTCLLVASLLLGSAALLPLAAAAPNVPYTPCPTSSSTNPWAGWQWPGTGTAFYCPATGMWCRNIGNGMDQCWGIILTPIGPAELAAVTIPYPVDTHGTYATVQKLLRGGGGEAILP